MKRWRKLLVVYDIEEDRIRTRVVRIVEGYGIRIQKSAFECFADDERLQEMLIQLRKVISQDDSIRVYYIDDYCFDVSTFLKDKVYSSELAII